MGNKPRTPEFYPKMRWRARSRVAHQIGEGVIDILLKMLNVNIERRATRGHANRTA